MYCRFGFFFSFLVVCAVFCIRLPFILSRPLHCPRLAWYPSIRSGFPIILHPVLSPHFVNLPLGIVSYRLSGYTFCLRLQPEATCIPPYLISYSFEGSRGWGRIFCPFITWEDLSIYHYTAMPSICIW